MSLKTNPVNWFEIPVTDMKRALGFYNDVFGLNMEPMDMRGHTFAFFPMAPQVPGAGGTLMLSSHVTPSKSGTTVYLAVESIDAALEKIRKAGGKTLSPKENIGPHGFIAHFEDSEGNRVALHEAAAS